MEDKFYVYGIFAGIAVGLVVMLVILLFNRKKGLDKYDERQMAGRGKAFRAGFFTLLVCTCFTNLDGLVYDLPGDPYLWRFSGMLVGMMTFVLTAIHYDAYLSLTDTPKRIYQTGLLLSVAMGLNAVSNFTSSANRSHLMGWFSAMIGASWLVVMAAMWLHNRRRKEDEEE